MEKGKRRLFIGILLIIFLGAAGGMCSVLLQYQKSRNFYSQAAEQYTSLVLSDVSDGSEETGTDSGDSTPAGENSLDTKDRLSEKAPLVVDFEALQAVNPDIIGWIYCADTIINYPVLQGEDNDFYLQHSYEKSPLKQGSIFIDVENKDDLSDRNTIIYGHHMKDGSMFSVLHSWRNQEFYEEHPVMWLLTPKQDYKIVLFSGYTASAYSDTYTIFPEEAYSGNAEKSLRERSPKAYQELETYLDSCAKKTNFRPEQSWQELCRWEEQEGDGEEYQEYRYVLLSTCAYEFDDARFVLHGVLIPN